MIEFPKDEKIVYFKFKKADGSIRYAAGTVDSGIINQYHKFSEKEPRKGNPSVQPYFDLDSLSFKSFKIENFIGFISEEEYENGIAWLHKLM